MLFTVIRCGFVHGLFTSSSLGGHGYLVFHQLSFSAYEMKIKMKQKPLEKRIKRNGSGYMVKKLFFGVLNMQRICSQLGMS